MFEIWNARFHHLKNIIENSCDSSGFVSTGFEGYKELMTQQINDTIAQLVESLAVPTYVQEKGGLGVNNPERTGFHLGKSKLMSIEQ